MTVYKVEDISMGVSHMSVIASDADINDKNYDFKILNDSERVLQQLKTFLKEHFNNHLEKDPRYEIPNGLNE